MQWCGGSAARGDVDQMQRSEKESRVRSLTAIILTIAQPVVAYFHLPKYISMLFRVFACHI